MIEIIIMIGVIGWFAKTAQSQGRSRVLWGFIGAISYYGPVLVFGLVIFPALIKGSVTRANVTIFQIVGIVLDLVVGIGGCLFARQILLSKEDSHAPVEIAPEAWECEVCGATVDANATVCPACGTQFES